MKKFALINFYKEVMKLKLAEKFLFPNISVIENSFLCINRNNQENIFLDDKKSFQLMTRTEQNLLGKLFENCFENSFNLTLKCL